MFTDGRMLLLQELTARKQRNSAYSLRAFARDLGVSAAALSQYLSRKREFSPKNRRSVVSRLSLSPLEQKTFELARKRLSAEDLEQETLSEDQFRLIGDWLSLAILNIARLTDARADVRAIARRLGVHVEEAREVLERLQRLQLIDTEGGKLTRTAKPFSTTHEIPSEAIQKYHLGLLRKAERALLDLPVEDRYITAITMPTDPAKLADARKILKKTAHQIAKLVATDTASEVHVLSTQLFPLTVKRSLA